MLHGLQADPAKASAYPPSIGEFRPGRDSKDEPEDQDAVLEIGNQERTEPKSILLNSMHHPSVTLGVSLKILRQR